MLDKMGQSEGNMHSNGEIDIKKGPATYVGNVTAIDKIDIAKDVTINGDVTAGDDLQLDNNVTITGTATEYANVSAEPLPQLYYSAGGNDVKVNQNQTQALTPGSYGKIEVEKNAKLQLSPGVYYFEELKLKENVNLEIDLATGPVTVNVVKKVDMHKNVTMSLAPLGDSDSRYVTINSLEDLQIDQGSKLLGTFNAPYKKAHLKKGVNLRGSVCAEEIDVDKDAVALHHYSSSPLPKISAPAVTADDAEDDSEELETEVAAVPTEFVLEQNYPNPFNPSTTIRFTLPEAGAVTLSIYNTHGQLVQTLVRGEYANGKHEVVWDGKDEAGVRVASGVYVYRIVASGFVAQQKLVIMK